MSLGHELLTIYPDLDLIDDVLLRDDGAGEYIHTWNDPRPQPTPEEIQAAVIPAKRLKLKAKINELTAAKIGAIFNLPANSNLLIIKQLNASARTTELQDIKINGGSLNEEEQLEFDAIKAIWNRIKALRLAGAQLEEIVENADPDTFDINAGWPE